jgi:hypothetical protein
MATLILRVHLLDSLVPESATQDDCDLNIMYHVTGTWEAGQNIEVCSNRATVPQLATQILLFI